MPYTAGPAVGAFAGSGNRAIRRSQCTSAALLLDEALSCRPLSDMPATWSCDCSKTTGFRYGLTPRQALRTALSPHHNEFYNVLTDLLPLFFFFSAAIYTMRTSPGYTASPAWLRHSFLMTSTFTVAQHALSCVAHTFSAVSARLSHTVWLLDYAGIALVNVHNAPAVIFIGWPQLGELLWCWWFGINLFATALIFGRSLHLTLTYKPTTQGLAWSQILADNGMLSAVGIATLIAPNMLGSLAVGFAVDWRAGAVPVIMLFALVVKERHIPERWFPAGKFDYSLFHSHSIWHLLVWLVQTLYLLVYISNFDKNDTSVQQQQHQR